MVKKIHCKWEQDKRLLVNPDGQAFPCCYLSNPYYQRVVGVDEGFVQHVMEKYHTDRDDLNVFKADIKDIINHKWFTETLPESWEDDDKVHYQCVRMCGVDDDE